MDNLTPEALKALSEAATPGEWTLGRIVDAPGGGRFRYVDAGGHYQAARFVWEMQTGEGDAQKAQTKLAVALVNAYRAGLLVHVDAEPEYRFADLYVEALAEIKATVDGQSDQPVKDIVYGLLAEIRLRADAVDTKGWDNG